MGGPAFPMAQTALIELDLHEIASFLRGRPQGVLRVNGEMLVIRGYLSKTKVFVAFAFAHIPSSR